MLHFAIFRLNFAFRFTKIVFITEFDILRYVDSLHKIWIAL